MLRQYDHGAIVRVEAARTVLGRPLHHVYCFFIDGLLIDTGPPATAAAMARWAASQRIHTVVVTHHHEDHSGGAPRLARTLTVPILAPPATVSILAAFPRIPLYRRLVWGQPGSVTVLPLPEVVETERYRFRVIPTPGHAADHVALFEEREGWLVSGDLYISPRAVYLRPVEDAWTILASLERLRDLKPKLLLCSHAGLVVDATGALERKIAYWRGLADKARTLAAPGARPESISRRLLGREGAMTAISLGDFSKRNLIRSLLEDPGGPRRLGD